MVIYSISINIDKAYKILYRVITDDKEPYIICRVKETDEIDILYFDGTVEVADYKYLEYDDKDNCVVYREDAEGNVTYNRFSGGGNLDPEQWSKEK